MKRFNELNRRNGVRNNLEARSVRRIPIDRIDTIIEKSDSTFTEDDLTSDSDSSTDGDHI